MRRMKFRVSMLDYCKMILEKLSFNKKLFKKEYLKSFKRLKPAEGIALIKWVRERFGSGIFSSTKLLVETKGNA
jgi:hypothetical protein